MSHAVVSRETGEIDEQSFEDLCVKQQELSEMTTDISITSKKPPQVVLFFSYDIVNSTGFKATINQWPMILSHIFKTVKCYVEQAIPSAEVWRILGDEIIFVTYVSELEDLFIYIDNIFLVLQSICKEIRSETLFNRYPDIAPYAHQLRSILGLKSACWIARIIEQTEGNDTTCEDNILTKYELSDNRCITEFLGNDVDEGFRLSKMVAQRRMVLSFVLAYLLSERTEYLNRLSIISYECLKGIWQNRPYPIIWYHDPKYCENIKFDDSFYYDEARDEKLSRKYFLNRVPHSEDPFPIPSIEMYTDIRRALLKICEDQILENKISGIKELLKSSEQPEKYMCLADTFDLDCVAVCFTQDSKVLLARHAQGKRNHSGKWYFGGHKILKDDKILLQLPKYYRREFGIEIKLILDTTKKVPKPLRIYESNYGEQYHKGIIMVAEIQDSSQLAHNNVTRNTEVLLMSVDEAKKISKDAAIPYFGDILVEALQFYNEWKNDANNL